MKIASRRTFTRLLPVAAALVATFGATAASAQDAVKIGFTDRSPAVRRSMARTSSTASRWR